MSNWKFGGIFQNVKATLSGSKTKHMEFKFGKSKNKDERIVT